MGDDTAGEGTVGASRDAIIGGADATMYQWGALVQVRSSLGACSGALLSDSWVLTARHCIPNGHLANPPSKPDMSIRNLNNVTRNVAEAFYMPGEYTYDPVENSNLTSETDVALLRVSEPFALDFGQSPFPIHFLYPYATSGLDGLQARCAGVGWRTLNGSGGPPYWASIEVASAGDDLISFIPEDDGTEIQAPGDSGGPCTKPSDGVQFQFSVNSAGAMDRDEDGNVIRITGAVGVSTQMFRDWALGIMKFGVGLYSERNYKGNAQTIANSSLTVERVGIKSVSSVRVPPGWQVTLWDTILPGSGNSVTLTGEVPDVPAGWHDRTQSVSVTQNGVQIYRDKSFLGPTLTLGPGRHDAAALGSLNNNISSLRIPSDWRVTTFADAGFAGRRLTFYGSHIGSLGTTDNDKISSIIVEQAVTVYTDALYYGQYQILWEGQYGYADLMVPDWSISSIIVPAGLSVTAYDDDHLTGSSRTFTSSQAWMPEGWDDRITSLRVTRAR